MTPNRRLKQARELRGWSQAKVAEQIGTDATTVSRWERGLFSPTPYFRERLCLLFDKNAEELGLLESERSHHEELERSPSSAFHSPAPQAFQQEHMDVSKGGVSTSTIAPPPVPSWPRRSDTFGYILDSAAHDQQAHILWEDAYVRAMRGQRAEAQQLGEASLNAFEHVGHPNAEALREWLKKNDLLPPTPSTEPLPPPPVPLHAKPARREMKSVFRPRNIGLAFVLLAIGVIGFASFILNQSPAPRVNAGTHNGPVAQTPVVRNTPGKTGGTTVATTGISAKPTSAPTVRPALPTATPNPNPLGINMMVSPTSLTPGACQPDSGYRCTLQVTLYSNSPVTITWQTSSLNLVATFNPPGGVAPAGKSFQIIVYIQSQPGESGQLIFTLTSGSSSHKTIVPWQG